MRVIRGNTRVQTIVGTVVDQHGVDLSNSLLANTLPQGPSSRGAQGWGNAGLTGDGVNAWSHMTASLQSFVGLTTHPLVKPRSKLGDLAAGSLPNDGSADSAIGWLDMGKGANNLRFGS